MMSGFSVMQLPARESIDVSSDKEDHLVFGKKSDFNKLIECLQESQRLFARQTMYYKIYGVCIGLLLFYLARQVYLLANKPISVVHFHQLPEDYFSNRNKYN